MYCNIVLVSQDLLSITNIIQNSYLQASEVMTLNPLDDELAENICFASTWIYLVGVFAYPLLFACIYLTELPRRDYLTNLMLCGQISMHCQLDLQVPPASETTAVTNRRKYWLHNLSTTHLTLQSFLSRSFPVPL